jgi:O-antigen ligase
MAEIKAITYRIPWFQKPVLLPVALALVGLFWLFNAGLGMTAALSIVLLAQAVFFILLIRRPVWAMAALIVGQLTACNYMVGLPGGTLMSLRFLWTILALLLLVPTLRRQGGIELGNRARRILIPAVIFFCWVTMTMSINTDMASTLKQLREIATALIIVILLPAAVKNERDLKILAMVALITCSVSALFALQQHWTMGFQSYTLYGNPIMYQRAEGLSESPVQLGFNLPMVLLPMVAIYFFKGVSSNARKILILLAIAISIALYFTFTRSGIYSLAPGLLLMALLMKGRARIGLLAVLLVMGVAFLYFINTSDDNRYSQTFGEETSAAGRLVLWQAGVKVACDNPIFGIGRDKFEEESLKYASVIDSELMTTQGAGATLGQYEAHNDFITVWASFGTVALLAYLWLFAGAFRNFLDAYRKSRSRFIKGLAVGCFSALAAYIVNAFTHYVMDTSELMWIMFGLSIATAKVALSQRKSKVKETA